MCEVWALRREEGAASWLFQQGGEDGEMDSVQRGMDILLGCTASEGR